MPYMARAGLGRIRSAGPGTFARAIDGHLGTATTSTPVALRQGASRPGPSRWMASRCVTGRSERTLAEPPFGAADAGCSATVDAVQNWHSARDRVTSRVIRVAPWNAGGGVRMSWKIPAISATAVVVGLAVGGAAVGLVVHGAAGALLGVVPGALAGVVAGFVPGLRDWAEARRAEENRASVAAHRAWDTAGESPVPGTSSGPAALLRPDRAVVEFTGRDTELRTLRAWCATSRKGSVRVVVGAGGVGKTRLALQVATDWEAAGGEWRLVAAGQESNAVAAVRGRTSGPVLLVVDYAETRSGLGELLRAVLGDPGPIRVLLLARSLGEWWERLAEQSAYAVARLLTEARPIHLDAPVSGAESDAELAARAVPCFARALGAPEPRQVDFTLPAGRVPVLVLHAAALVAVLRSTADPILPLRVVVASGVMDELLEHEARYWRRAASAAGLSADGSVLKPVVAAAALLGADDLNSAAALAGRIPDLTQSDLGTQRRWARWLFGLYPPEVDGQLGSLQPDLLAEIHVTTQLTADPGLAQACLRGLTQEQAERALAVLARAWEHHDNARQLITTALRDDLACLAIPASRVALQTRGELGEVLAATLRDGSASLEALTDIANAIPYPSLVLAQAGLAVTDRVRKSLPPDSKEETVATWDERVALMLGTLGHYTAALAASQEVVNTYRALATADPDRYRADLARSLNNLAVSFSELGRRDEALPVAREAMTAYRGLATADPDLYGPDLATSLDNLALRLLNLRRPADALPFAQEAITIRRELAAANPDRYRPDLAISQTHLSSLFSDLGRPADALSFAQDAVTIRRELADADPDRYRADLATSLGSLAIRLSELGRPSDALPYAQEIIIIYRELAAASPDRYRTDLAASLGNLAVRLSELDCLADALPLEEEAVTIRRELAATDPDRYRAHLASSLNNLAASFSERGRLAEARSFAQEAVTIRRELAATDPDRYRADLADSLINLSSTCWALGSPAEALPFLQESVTVYRELAAISPDRYRAGLATSLAVLSFRYSELDQRDDALALLQEVVTIRRELADANPDRYRPDLADSLTNLAVMFSEIGRLADTLIPFKEAVILYRELAAISPDRYRPDLAKWLYNLASTFTMLGRLAEGLPLFQEAVAIYRELAVANPDSYASELASCLSNLSFALSAMDRSAEALPPAEDTVTIFRGLAAADPDRYRPHLAQALSNLAANLSELQRDIEAEVAFREATAIRESF